MTFPRLSFTIAVVTATLVATISPAVAKSVSIDAAGVRAWVPDKWQVAEQDGTTVASSPNQDASVVFVSKAIRKVDSAYKRVPDMLATMVSNPTLDEASNTTVGGMSAILASGTAESGGVELEIRALVAITPAKRALYAITFVDGAKASKYDKTFDKILSKLTAASSKTTGAAKAADNKCWELKGRPNGWKKKSWRGVSYLLPRGWKQTVETDPNTDDTFLSITSDAGSVMVMVSNEKPKPAWQAARALFGTPLSLGDASRGKVGSAKAICARGSGDNDDGGRFTSDVAVIARGGGSIIAAGQVTGSASEMRAILGSLRSR